MGFGAAVRNVLANYATFSGRAGRSEFWWFTLFWYVVNGVALLFELMLDVPKLSLIAWAALIVPWGAVAVRRLHDTGRSGWKLLISIIPLFGFVWLVVVAAQESHRDNQYGQAPQGSTSEAANALRLT